MNSINSLPSFDPVIAGKRVKIAIKAVGVKQYTVSKGLGVSERKLKYMLNGKYFTLDEVQKCSDYFKVDIEFFIIQDSQFEEETFISRVQSASINKSRKENKDIIKFTFCGRDSLAIASICKLFDSNKIINSVTAIVIGISKYGYRIEKTGKIRSYQFNGYIRSFSIVDELGQIFSVGGDNSTLEDIAAQIVQFELKNDYSYIFLDNPFSIYQNENSKNIQSSFIEYMLSSKQYSLAINNLKIKSDYPALKELFKIDKKSIPSEIMELLFDSYRSFDKVYESSKECSKQITNKLICDLDFLIEKDQINSAIYCMESLGYSATKNIDDFNLLYNLVSVYMRNGMEKYPPDLIRATFVSLSNNKKVIENLSKRIELEDTLLNLSEIIDNNKI